MSTQLMGPLERAGYAQGYGDASAAAEGLRAALAAIAKGRRRGREPLSAAKSRALAEKALRAYDKSEG